MQNFDRNFANLVAPPTGRSVKCLVRCKAHLIRNAFRKQCPNQCINSDAILPQTGMKMTKNAVLNLALCCGAIWRQIEKPQYRCTTTIHPVYNCSKFFRKIYFNLYYFWCTKTCSFRTIYGLPIRYLTIAVSAT